MSVFRYLVMSVCIYLCLSLFMYFVVLYFVPSFCSAFFVSMCLALVVHVRCYSVLSSCRSAFLPAVSFFLSFVCSFVISLADVISFFRYFVRSVLLYVVRSFCR